MRGVPCKERGGDARKKLALRQGSSERDLLSFIEHLLLASIHTKYNKRIISCARSVLLRSCFIKEEIEAQRGKVTHLRTHEVGERKSLGFSHVNSP